LVASNWASGSSPASPKRGTTSPAILSSSFMNHTVRVQVLHASQTPLTGRMTDRQSKVFEPTTIEIRFQRLHKVEEGSQQASLVPVIQREPSPEDGPGYIRSVTVTVCFSSTSFFLAGCTVLSRRDGADGLCLCRLSDDVMQSTFAAPEDDHFLTFVILFYPPVPTITFPPLSTTPITSPEPGLGSYHAKFPSLFS
jgi:hypothetical protein